MKRTIKQTESKHETEGRVSSEEKIVVAKKARQCEHIKTNGEFCGSPALRGRKHCFFHLTHLGRRIRAEHMHEIALKNSFEPSYIPMELPLLEDANSIQLGLSQVVDAILHCRLDNKRAGLILYALQTASANLGNGVDFTQNDDSAPVATRYEDFEEDFQIADIAPELKEVKEEAEAAQPASTKGTQAGLAPRLERAATSQRLEISTRFFPRSEVQDPHNPKEGLYGAPA